MSKNDDAVFKAKNLDLVEHHAVSTLNDCRYSEGVFNAFTFCIEHSMTFQEVFGLEGKGSTFIRNVGKCLPSRRRKVLENENLQQNCSEEINLTRFIQLLDFRGYKKWTETKFQYWVIFVSSCKEVQRRFNSVES